MMRLEYDKDAFYPYLEYPLGDGAVKRTTENVILDYGKLLGIEIPNASRTMSAKALEKATH